MKYQAKLLLLCMVLALLATLPYFVPSLWDMHHTSAFVMIPLFGLLTLFQHQYLIRSTKGSPTAFVRAFMGMTVMKILLLAGGFIITLVLGIPEPFRFTGWFVLIYISFLIYEVTLLSQELKKAS